MITFEAEIVPEDGKKRSITVTKNTREEAEARIKEIIAECGYVLTDPLVADEWEEYATGKWRKKTNG